MYHREEWRNRFGQLKEICGTIGCERSDCTFQARILHTEKHDLYGRKLARAHVETGGIRSL